MDVEDEKLPMEDEPPVRLKSYWINIIILI